MAVLFLLQQHHGARAYPAEPGTWPTVTVQLPVFNEQFVVERLIDAAAALDYPRQALSIQVLDDSTDRTLDLSRERVAAHCRHGVNIELIHRAERSGYKAGALAAGLQTAPGEFIAIFDADFVPPADFLRRLVPYLAADPGLGMVQARWGHLNEGYNLLTRAQALFLDGHFIVEQSIRCRSGLLFNFNGSAGVWRRSCIEDAGGWHDDTLSEDLDLSYRAQLKGWRFAFIPEVVAPAEIPPQVAALKQQQYRWARGSIQVLLKLSGQIWRSQISGKQRLGSFLHLSAYLAHPLMMILFLSCFPLVLEHEEGLPSLGLFSLAGFGPPLLFAVSQWGAYPDWRRRIFFFPFLVAMGVGIAFNNTRAVLAAISRRPSSFIRTPKYRLQSRHDVWRGKAYRLPIEWSVWVELALSAYALLCLVVAIKKFPPLAPTLALFTLGFGYVSILGIVQGRKGHRRT